LGQEADAATANGPAALHDHRIERKAVLGENRSAGVVDTATAIRQRDARYDTS
jgi:hypothetical protein